MNRIDDTSVAIFLTDSRIKADLGNVNIDRLKQHLEEQFYRITNDPCVYHGQSIGLGRSPHRSVNAEGVETGE